MRDAKNNKIQKTSAEPGKEKNNWWNAVGYSQHLNFTLPPDQFCILYNTWSETFQDKWYPIKTLLLKCY